MSIDVDGGRRAGCRLSAVDRPRLPERQAAYNQRHTEELV